MNMQTRISAKGQVVIPKGVRERLKWVQGAPLDVVETADGVLLKRADKQKTLSPDEALALLRQRYKYTGPPVSIQDMNETIAEEWKNAALKSDCAKR